MKMFLAAVLVFPASWVAIPPTPPRLSIMPRPADYRTICSGIASPRPGALDWRTARLARGVREVADLDRLGEGPVVVIDAKLAGQRLAGHRLAGICFEGGDLTRTDWRGVRAADVAFGRADLSDAVMTGAGLRGARFKGSILDRVEATRIDLTDARIAGGSFDGLVLRAARMRGFGLRCGLLSGEDNCAWPEKQGVDARGADLSGAALNLYRTDAWRFDGAVLDGTTVQFHQIESFRPATVRGPVILESSGYFTEAKVRLDKSEWRALLAGLWTDRPSFDCVRARTVVERSICASDNALEARDRRLAQLFEAVRAEGKTTRAEQRAWLRTRDACGSRTEEVDRDDCISGAYDERIDALMRRGAHPRWIRAGARRVYVSNDVAPPAAFQRTRLYERIFPVLLASAGTWVYVHARDREVVVASGDAIGGNGHLCDLAEGAYAFDAGSGWFGAQRSADYRNFYPDAPAFEALLHFAGDDAEVGPPEARGNNGEYVSCGARAGFDTLAVLRVPATQHAAVVERAPGFFDPDI